MKKTTQFLSANLKLKGLKIISIELKENELRVALQNKQRLISLLVFSGIIGFKECGSVGKGLTELFLADKGSFKVMRIRNLKGKILFHCECMEGTFLAAE